MINVHTVIMLTILMVVVFRPILVQVETDRYNLLKGRLHSDKLQALRRRYPSLNAMSDAEIEDRYCVDWLYYR